MKNHASCVYPFVHTQERSHIKVPNRVTEECFTQFKMVRVMSEMRISYRILKKNPYPISKVRELLKKQEDSHL